MWMKRGNNKCNVFRHLAANQGAAKCKTQIKIKHGHKEKKKKRKKSFTLNQHFNTLRWFDYAGVRKNNKRRGRHQEEMKETRSPKMSVEMITMNTSRHQVTLPRSRLGACFNLLLKELLLGAEAHLSGRVGHLLVCRLQIRNNKKSVDWFAPTTQRDKKRDQRIRSSDGTS
jgi:hypothetical protein